MLIELSLFSGAGAYFVISSSLWPTARMANPVIAFAGVTLIVLAGLIQLGVLFTLISVRTRRIRIFLYVEASLGVLALLCILCGAWQKLSSLYEMIRAVGGTPILFILAGYLFWRLGEKHWKQTIDEQIVLVNARSSELRKACAKKLKEPTMRPEYGEYL